MSKQLNEIIMNLLNPGPGNVSKDNPTRVELENKVAEYHHRPTSPTTIKVEQARTPLVNYIFSPTREAVVCFVKEMLEKYGHLYKGEYFEDITDQTISQEYDNFFKLKL